MAKKRSHCNTEMAVDAVFCTVCGKCVLHSSSNCPICTFGSVAKPAAWSHCGQGYGNDEKFCGVCGKCRKHSTVGCDKCSK